MLCISLCFEEHLPDAADYLISSSHGCPRRILQKLRCGSWVYILQPHTSSIVFVMHWQACS